MSNANFVVPDPVNEPVCDYAPGSIERTLVEEELKAQKGQVAEIPVRIGEAIGSGAGTENVVCPHQHKHVLAQVQQATPEDVDTAIKTTLAARREWAALPWEERAAVFLKAADLLANSYRPAMNAATMLGQSKTVFQAEIDATCELVDFFKYNAKFAEFIYSEQPVSGPDMWNRSSARGLEGFVFAVTPFNFTSIAVNLPAAPALMGCSVLWKPAPTSLHSAYLGYQILEEAGLPPGVITFVPGDAQMIGAKVLEHPDLAGVHFTGSTATFNYLWKTVGNNIDKYRTYPRIVGETGGKDFIFAHPSADPQALMIALVRGAFEYQGQKCSAASRAYIPKSVWAEIKDDLVAMTNELSVGSPEDLSNFMAAVIDDRSFAKIKGYIDHAKDASDAKIIAGGQCDDSEGYFVRPTIIEAADPKYRSMVEEIFGPVLSIYVYDDNRIDDALTLCDESSAYGLTGAIFAQDRYAIHAMSKRLEHTAGNFYINDKPTGAVVGQQPFGGSRASGTNDKAGSMYNLLRWTSQRTMKETFVPPYDYRYPHMD